MGCLFCIISGLFAVGIALKIFLKLRLKYNGSYKCLVGKTAIVTGANTGIGYVTALDFAKRGARVILACRNKDRAEEAQRKIIKATNNTNVVYKILNLASFQSVRQFAKEFNESEDRLDILVNNAGAGFMGNHTSEDGLEITLQVNHISPFLLTHLILEKMKKTGGGRIINVSSMAAKFAKFNLNKINEYPRDMNTILADMMLYGNSKLCNIYFTTELMRKLEQTDITVNALHPGAVNTDLSRRIPSWMKPIFTAIASAFFMTCEEGAQTTIYLAVSEDVEGVTGKFFDNCKDVGLYNTAKDPELGKKLWSVSEDLAKLTREEKLR